MGSAVGMGFAVDSDMDYRVVVVVVACRVVDRDFVDMDFVVGRGSVVDRGFAVDRDFVVACMDFVVGKDFVVVDCRGSVGMSCCYSHFHTYFGCNFEVVVEFVSYSSSF